LARAWLAFVRQAETGRDEQGIFTRMKIAYFVHDLNDPAVRRRLQMLYAAGMEVTLLGFSRGNPPVKVETLTPIVLGRTEDGRLGQRIGAVLRAALTAPRWQGALDGADVVMARQLETLALAARARDRVAPNARLVYECLDVHRLMIDPGPAGRVLRLLEGRLLRRCQALIVSSPEFIRSHFARRYRNLPRVELIENKVLARELGDPGIAGQVRNASRPRGPPWRIGWFGVIRCRRSLDLLAALARSHQGMAEVIIRGRIASNVIPDFASVVSATPNLSYLGPYDRRQDLGSIYGEVHFAWAIDYYEEGANSDWLLPNRLYESGLFGAVAITRDGVATATWLQQHGIGVCLNGDPGAALDGFIETLDQAAYDRSAAAVRALPARTFLYDDEDCATLMNAVSAVTDP
jgi:succinoglycan biosynthesis protein ExoL